VALRAQGAHRRTDRLGLIGPVLVLIEWLVIGLIPGALVGLAFGIVSGRVDAPPEGGCAVLAHLIKHLVLRRHGAITSDYVTFFEFVATSTCCARTATATPSPIRPSRSISPPSTRAVPIAGDSATGWRSGSGATRPKSRATSRVSYRPVGPQPGNSPRRPRRGGQDRGARSLMAPLSRRAPGDRSGEGAETSVDIVQLRFVTRRESAFSMVNTTPIVYYKL